MLIYSDKKIPAVEKTFSSIKGVEFKYFSGSDNIDPNLLQVTDLLLVRSTTVVDQNLLDGNINGRLVVGTATSGLDHIDQKYLASEKITLLHARGANSRAVKDYVIWSILEYLVAEGKRLEDVTVGVVGCGMVGSKVWKTLVDLGVKVVPVDPPLNHALNNHTLNNQALSNSESLEYGNWSELSLFLKNQLLDFSDLVGVDILTFHVPLIKVEEGEYPTDQFFGLDWLERMRDGGLKLLINTARGEIISDEVNTWLVENSKRNSKENFEGNSEIKYIYDVWPTEPKVDAMLPDAVLLKNSLFATPHLAGHSLLAKEQATFILFQKYLELTGSEVKVNFSERENYSERYSFPKKLKEGLVEIGEMGRSSVNLLTGSREEVLLYYVRKVFKEIEKCSNNLKQHPDDFTKLRQRHGARRELGELLVKDDRLSDELKNYLRLLDIQVD